jgi:tRNA(Ile)-lysidine synthase TilS/MesJ
MTPCREYFNGQMRLVRPLCCVDEKELHRFARISAFPAPPPTCSRSDQSRRKLAADLLRQARRGCQDAQTNLLRAGLKGIHNS